MNNFSMLAASLLIVIIMIDRFWQPSRRAIRLALSLATLGIGLILFVQPSVDVDPRIAGPVTDGLFLIGGTLVLVFAIRTFVTDYRRATAERERG